MLANLKVIFLHGVNHQQTSYSGRLFQRVLKHVALKLRARGYPEGGVRGLCDRIVHHEVMWADLTTDLTNRYCQLQYHQRSRRPWTGIFPIQAHVGYWKSKRVASIIAEEVLSVLLSHEAQ